MRGDALGDLGHLGRRVAGAIELTRRHRVDRVKPGKQPDLWPRDAPPVAQKFQQLWREHRVTILAALARSEASDTGRASDAGPAPTWRVSAAGARRRPRQIKLLRSPLRKIRLQYGNGG